MKLRDLRQKKNQTGKRTIQKISTASLIAALAGLSSSALAQNGWSTKASLPTGGSTMSAAAINGILYVAGGNNGSPMANLQAYNVTNNTWSSLTALPGGRYQNSGMGVISNKLYFPGGWTTSPPLPNNNLWVYDPLANTWATKATMPLLSAQGASGVISNKLYVTTAANGLSGYYSYLHVYDPATDTWTAKANSPRPHANPAAGVIGNKFYVAGGFDGNNTTNILDVYDPVSNTWTTKAPMRTSRFITSGAVVDGKLCVFGGLDASGTYTNSVEVYDPATDSWSSETPMPTKRGGNAAGTVNGIVYVVGGGNSTNSALGTVEALLPTQTSINLYAGIWVSGVVGGTYEIDYRVSLTSGSWNLVTNIVLASNPTLFIDTNNPVGSIGFYRTQFLH